MSPKVTIPPLRPLLLTLAATVLVACQPTAGPARTDGSVAYCSADVGLTARQPIQSHRSYCVKSDAAKKTFQPGLMSSYRFSIIDDRGETLRDFAVVHEKIMHVIVVRQDLAEFQHIHPEYNVETGAFTLPSLIFPSAGPYRIFADFTPANSPKDPHGNLLGVTIFEDTRVGAADRYSPKPLGPETRIATVADYVVRLTANPPLVTNQESVLTFGITRGAQAVTTLTPYLGALGHAVILREGSLDFIHTHPIEKSADPQNGNIRFAVTVPDAGKYKVFLQFQHQDEVVTSDFLITATAADVSQDNATPTH